MDCQHLVLDFTPSPDSQAFRDIEQVAKLTADWPASLRDRLFKTITANVCARLDCAEDGRIQWLLYVADPVHSGLLQCVEQLPKTHPHLFTQTQAAGPAPQPVSPASADPSTSRCTELPGAETEPGTSMASDLGCALRPQPREAEAVPTEEASWLPRSGS